MSRRGLSLFRLSQLCGVSYSTLKSARKNGGQLTVDTIQRICDGLGITMAEFFSEDEPRLDLRRMAVGREA